MIVIAFYLALILFFANGKSKKIIGYISIGLTIVSLILVLLVYTRIFSLDSKLLKPVFIFHNYSPLYWLFRARNFMHLKSSSFNQLLKLQKILQIVELAFQLIIAFIALNLNSIISAKQKQSKNDETQNCSTEINTNIENQDSSYFDGGLLQLIGWKLLGLFITLITFGICYPWSFTMLYSWETQHTVINGKRLSFNGTALQLFGSWIKWILLTIITLGIYAFWIPIKLKQWKIKHTS